MLAVIALAFASAISFHAAGAIDHGHGTEASATADDEAPRLVDPSPVALRTRRPLTPTARGADGAPPEPITSDTSATRSTSPPWQPPPRRGPPRR